MIIKATRKFNKYKSQQKGGTFLNEAITSIIMAKNTINELRTRVDTLRLQISNSSVQTNTINNQLENSLDNQTELESLTKQITELEKLFVNNQNTNTSNNDTVLEEINKQLTSLETRINNTNNNQLYDISNNVIINDIIGSINVKLDNQDSYKVNAVPADNNVVYRFDEIINTTDITNSGKALTTDTLTKLTETINIIETANDTNIKAINNVATSLNELNKHNSETIKNIEEKNKLLTKINIEFTKQFIVTDLNLPNATVSLDDIIKVGKDNNPKLVNPFIDPKIKNDKIPNINQNLDIDETNLIHIMEAPQIVSNNTNISDPNTMNINKKQTGGKPRNINNNLKNTVVKTNNNLKNTEVKINNNLKNTVVKTNNNLENTEVETNNNLENAIINFLNGDIDKYKKEITDIYINMLELNKLIIQLNKNVKEYNIKYIHMYNHIDYIKNSIKLSLLSNKNEDNYIIGRGIVAYYLDLIEQIEKEIKNKTPIGIFFYKYHYLNIQITKNFLDKLNKHVVWLWDGFNSDNTEFKKTIDMINAENITKENKDKKIINLYRSTNMIAQLNLDAFTESKIRNTVFIYNSFKSFLDKYQLEMAVPVAIYLRINDWGGINDKELVFNVKVDERNKLNIDNINNCFTPITPTPIQAGVVDVKFKQIFNQDDFKDNGILANYMALPNFLNEGKAIMLITYGYSGVGKTFTIFGTKELSGVLQATLKSLNGTIYYRTYEIYGRAFPYKSYWDSKNGYDHWINHFKNDLENSVYISKETKYEDKKNNQNTYSPMEEYINKTDIGTTEYNGNVSITDNTSTYTILSNDDLNNFASIVGSIDKRREEIGTIKRTINNVSSSRSIMVYDFKIKLGDNRFVDFVIMDLPGKEDIYETFVKTPASDQYECIKLKSNNGINTDINEMIKAMAYMNPMSLAMNDAFVNLISKGLGTYANMLEAEKQNNLLGDGIDKANNFTGENKFLGSKDVEIINNLNTLELIKNIIDNNRFDILNDIYKKIFNQLDKNILLPSEDIQDKNKLCSTSEQQLLAPFEGYYINENITGLLSSILSNLYLPNIIEEQKELYMNLKDDVNIWDKAYDSEPTEVKVQTYFFRKALRNGYKLNIKNNYTGKAHVSTTFNNVPINTYQDWTEKTYDYNKAYKKHKPPINKILKSYFKKIKNIYIFYVVSNQNFKKCDKQIKLITDSKNILDVLNNYNKTNNEELEKILENNRNATFDDKIKLLNTKITLTPLENYSYYQLSNFYNLLTQEEQNKFKPT